MKRWTKILVALGIALSFQTAAAAHAQFSATLSVGDPYPGTLTFRTAPDMMLIPNTDVYTVRGATDYDLYRYDGAFYLVDDGNWYRADSWRGPFTYVRMESVPRSVVTIPAGYRRTWSRTTTNDTWRDNDNDNDWNSADRSGDVSTTRRYVVRESRSFRPGTRYGGTYLSFRRPPRMALVPGTRVFYVRDNTFDRDLYRYAGDWYYVENGVWYAADSWRGPYFTVRWRDVPASVRRLPSEYRRTWTFAGSSDYDRDRVYRSDDNYSRGRDYSGRSTRIVRYGERTDFVLDSPPSMSIIPGTSVYFMRDDADYDLYRYGNSWFLVDSGNWYRAPSWRGPFVRIRTNAVPRTVFTIPSGYRKTWVPTMD